jgi:truncated hemoglobin YjbI
MREALAEQDLPAEADSVLWQYLLGAAFAMQNITDDAPPANAIDVMEV